MRAWSCSMALHEVERFNYTLKYSRIDFLSHNMGLNHKKKSFV